MKSLISVDEARASILAVASLQPPEYIPLGAALDRTLAEGVVSLEAIPPFDNSAMDGFAVRAADLTDLPVVLRIVGEVAAGVFPERPVAPGTCMRIMTGAPRPEGADTVVPIEWTEKAGDWEVRILRAPAERQYVRPAGQDVRAGEIVVNAGVVVTPPIVGLLATVGAAWVSVRVPPRMTIISTGDELVDVSATLKPGQIRDSNGLALAAQAHTAGAEVISLLRAPDVPAQLQAIIERALDADVLLFSGGVSVGDYDYVKTVLDDMGLELLFWKVRQRPGKPLVFGRLGQRLVFGLPGNPVSAAMCFEQYVRPTLAAMLGRAEVMRPRHPATLAAPIAKDSGLHHFIRGIAAFGEDGRLMVRNTGPQASNLYTSVVRANCIVHLPEEMENPDAGTPVEIEWLTW